MRLPTQIIMALGLLIIAVSAGAGEPVDDPLRLTRVVEPVFQAIELDLDAESDTYTGRVRIDIEVKRETQSFRFHALDVEMDGIELSGGGEMFDVEYEVGEKGTVTLTADRTLAPGQYVLAISFSNEYNRKAASLYKVEFGGDGYLFTQFQDEHAREAFPSWDDPGFKFPYQMTLTVPTGHLAVANTPVESKTEADGKTTFVFYKTKPMPSYLLAIATGPLESVEISGLSVPGRVYTAKGQSHLAKDAVEITPPIMEALEKYFGRPYPYRKLDVIAIPEFLYGAMENVGHITFRDQLLLMDPESRSIGQRRTMTMIMAHEIGHMWFGNLVTPLWWDDLWLNESFATWIAYKVTDQVYPEFKYTVADVRTKQGAMAADALPSCRAIHQPLMAKDDPFEAADVLTYQKGQAVLAMTETWLGEEVFREGIVLHMEKYEWKNATSDDLWLSLATAAGAEVEDAIRSFIDEPGVPLVGVKSLGGNRVELSQQRFANYGAEMPPSKLWGIPVIMRYSDDEQVYTQRVMLDEASQSVELMTPEAPVWIHPNGDERGYYRWSVPAVMLDRIMREDMDKLTIRERVGLINNLEAMLNAGELRGDEFLEAVRLMNSDEESDVLKAVANSVQSIYESFITEDTLEPFEVYVQKTLRPTLDQIGMDARPGEDEGIPSLRSTLMLWLGLSGDKEVRDKMIEIAQTYEKDPASVDAALIGTAMRVAAYNGDAALFDHYVERFKSSQRPRERINYLTALASFKDRALLDKALAFTLSGDVPPHEIWRIPVFAAADHRNRAYVFEWMMANYDAIAGAMPPMYFAYTVPNFVDGNSMELVEACAEFMSVPERQNPMFDKELKKVSESVARRVAIREKEGARVDAYLRELVQR